MKKPPENKDKQLIGHIIHFGDLAIKECETLSYDELCKDSIRLIGVTTCLQFIGEAAGKISKEKREEFPNIPWKDIKGMRNILVHMYYEADTEIIWRTLTKYLPEVLDQLKSHDYEPYIRGENKIG